MKFSIKNVTAIIVINLLLLTSHIFADSYAGQLSPVASFWGPEEDWRLGYFLSQAGDVNGDGYDDFMIGAYHDCTHGFNAGVVYLFLGRSSFNWGMDCPVKTADHIFYGRQEYDLLGFNFSGGGDINGDGYSDILIGAPGNWEGKPYAGEAFVLLGSPNPQWNKNARPYYQANASFIGEDPYEQLGYSVGFAGDVNRDGYDDILVGVPFKNRDGETWNGKAYLVAGSEDGWDARHVSINERAAASFVFSGNEALTGFCVNGIGDINDDEFQDFAISAPGAQHIFVMFGKKNINWGFDFDLQHADLTFLAEMANDDAGNRICTAGDVNGDGIDDFLISSTKFKFQGRGFEGGKTYLIFGRRQWNQTEISLSEVDASFTAEGPYNHAGFGISGLGDIDADRYDDFMIGARWYSGQLWHSGKAYLYKGRESGWSRNTELKDCEIFFRGDREQSCVGWGVSTAGDVNGDGLSDYFISAPFDREAGVCSGQVYLFRGQAAHSRCAINGTVSYWADSTHMENVSVHLTGDDTQTIITDQSGEYQFEVPISRNYVVTPNCSHDGTQAISAYDAWLTARFAVNLNTPNEFQTIVADINQDNKLTAYDASLILQHTVGKILPSKYTIGNWMFSPESTAYSPAIYETEIQNYTGMITGDVDGSWIEADSLASQQNVASVYPADVTDGKVLSYPITLKSREKMYAFQATIEFDPAELRFQGFEHSNAPDDLVFEYLMQSNNIIKISGYALHGLPDTGFGVHPAFEVLTDTRPAIKLHNPVVNRSNIKYQPISSSVENETDRSARFELHQNYPNPFNPGTTIPYTLNEETRVVIVITNIRGQTIRQYDMGVQPAGSYHIEWDGRDQAGCVLPSGIYLYSIRTKTHTVVKKMVRL